MESEAKASRKYYGQESAEEDTDDEEIYFGQAGCSPWKLHGGLRDQKDVCAAVAMTHLDLSSLKIYV